MIATLPNTAPGVDPHTVLVTGATQIRTAFGSDATGVLVSYMQGIKIAFAISIGATGAAFIVSFFSSWRRLNGQAVKEAVMAA
jgi:hypothetical protein